MQFLNPILQLTAHFGRCICNDGNQICISADNFHLIFSAQGVPFQFPFQQEGNKNLHYNHTKFRISAYVAEYIKVIGFSAAASKLIFSIIFLQDQTDEGWPGSDENHDLQQRFVSVAELRELGFPSNTRSSRFLRKPVAELNEVSWIFDHLKIGENGRFLTWKFSNVFVGVMSDMEIYGLIDASEIRLSQRKLGGALLAQIPSHRRKRMPEFRLFGPNRGFERPEGFAQPNLVPSQVERQLRPVLQIWANATKISFAVLLVQEGAQPGYTDVVIRMRHKETKWPEQRFTKQPVGAQMWMVSPEGDTQFKIASRCPQEGPPFSQKKG